MFRTVCSHKVVAVEFNTLCCDAERRGINLSARINALEKGIFPEQAAPLGVFIFSR